MSETAAVAADTASDAFSCGSFSDSGVFSLGSSTSTSPTQNAMRSRKNISRPRPSLSILSFNRDQAGFLQLDYCSPLRPAAETSVLLQSVRRQRERTSVLSETLEQENLEDRDVRRRLQR